MAQKKNGREKVHTARYENILASVPKDEFQSPRLPSGGLCNGDDDLCGLRRRGLYTPETLRSGLQSRRMGLPT